MIPLQHLLLISGAIFSFGLLGIMLHRKNIILLLMCIELILLAVNTNFVAFSKQLNDVTGELFVFFILTVAAAEAAIGLAIIMLLFRASGNIDVENMTKLKG